MSPRSRWPGTRSYRACRGALRRGLLWQRALPPRASQGYFPNVCSEGAEPILPWPVFSVSLPSHMYQDLARMCGVTITRVCSLDLAQATEHSIEPSTQHPAPPSRCLPNMWTTGERRQAESRDPQLCVQLHGFLVTGPGLGIPRAPFFANGDSKKPSESCCGIE